MVSNLICLLHVAVLTEQVPGGVLGIMCARHRLSVGEPVAAMLAIATFFQGLSSSWSWSLLVIHLLDPPHWFEFSLFLYMYLLLARMKWTTYSPMQKLLLFSYPSLVLRETAKGISPN